MQWIKILFIGKLFFGGGELVFRNPPEQLRLSSLIKGLIQWLVFEVTTIDP